MQKKQELPRASLGDLPDIFPHDQYALWQVLPPLSLTSLILHLPFLTCIGWTSRVWTRLPCKFGLVTRHAVIQLSMRWIMLLMAALKTFLISILSLSVTNGGKYSTWVSGGKRKESGQLPGKPALHRRCLETSCKDYAGLRAHSTISVSRYLCSCLLLPMPFCCIPLSY